MIRQVAWLAVASLCVSCVTPPPRAPVPDLSLPAHWAASAWPGRVEEGAWWETLGGPELGSLVSEALAFNRDLRQAAARVEAAAAQARIAGAPFHPQ